MQPSLSSVTLLAGADIANIYFVFQAQSLPLFVWVCLISVSARGSARSLMVSMGPLFLQRHFSLSHSSVSTHYFLPLVLSALLFPLISLTLSHRHQLLAANLFLCLSLLIFPFCPQLLMVSSFWSSYKNRSNVDSMTFLTPGADLGFSRWGVGIFKSFWKFCPPFC